MNVFSKDFKYTTDIAHHILKGNNSLSLSVELN